VQVHRRLRELLPERAVGITDLFRFPTIAALAEFLGGGDGARPGSRTAPHVVRHDATCSDGHDAPVARSLIR
jgi:hypothetical protein